MTFDEIVGAYRRRSLYIDFVDISLVQDTDEQPISYKGKGYIRQTGDDTLTFTLYAFETSKTDFASSLNRNSPDTSSFAARLAPLTGFGNGNSPLPRAKSD